MKKLRTFLADAEPDLPLAAFVIGSMLGLMVGLASALLPHSAHAGRYTPMVGTTAVLDTTSGQLCEPDATQPGTDLPVCGK